MSTALKLAEKRGRQQRQDPPNGTGLEERTPTRVYAVVDEPSGGEPAFEYVVFSKPGAAGPEATRSSKHLVGDTMIQMAREDTAFCGTGGELALRLCAVLEHARTPDDARAVFVGFKVWSFSIAPNRRIFRSGRREGTALEPADAFDTTPMDGVVRRLAPGALYLPLPLMDRVPVSFPAAEAAWVALDGSACGVAPTPALLKELDALRVLRGIQSPLLVFPPRPGRAPPGDVLSAVVFLSGAGGLLPGTRTSARGLPVGSDDIRRLRASGAGPWSANPFGDLRVGSHSPRVFAGPWQRLPAVSAAAALSGCASPAAFSARFLRTPGAPPVPPCGLPSDDQLQASTLGVAFLSCGPWVGLGPLQALLADLSSKPGQLPAPDAVAASWRTLWLLFGPPMHLFAPLPWGRLVPLVHACRVSPEAPHEPEPARLAAPGAPEDAAARRLVAATVPGDWLSADTAPPRRPAGSIRAPQAAPRQRAAADE